ncbi:hypothetical protein ACMSI6_05430 [Pseudomonas antarctica]|uniref:hypothetical protein n=1 Tax=Pseudomonas antarctica TaxID=219572 RepID=UPI00387AB53A
MPWLNEKYSVLRAKALRLCQTLENTKWADGEITAGPPSANTKRNLHLPEGHRLAHVYPRRAVAFS